MKDEADLLSALADEFARRQREEFIDHVQHLSRPCESPIERVFLAALEVEKPENVICLDVASPLPSDCIGRFFRNSSVEYAGVIIPQCKLEHYRADLYFEAVDKSNDKIWFRAAIECDGHDFHEKTKEQASRDKRRDRWFQARGIAVYRFAGSEIWADPIACAEQVWEAFYSAYRRHFRPGQAT